MYILTGSHYVVGLFCDHIKIEHNLLSTHVHMLLCMSAYYYTHFVHIHLCLLSVDARRCSVIFAPT